MVLSSDREICCSAAISRIISPLRYVPLGRRGYELYPWFSEISSEKGDSLVKKRAVALLKKTLVFKEKG